MDEKTRNLYWHQPSVTVDDRRMLYDFRSCVIWLTGLPASGKSTIANALCSKLHSMRIQSYVLDGDNVRQGLNKDLGFGPEDREENIRRIGEVARLFVDAGLIVMTAFISPRQEDRVRARSLVKNDEFIEVFVKCSLQECERRDPKGMYRRARAGLVKEFTGVSAPYEEPEHSEVVLDTARMSVEECVSCLLDYLIQNGHIKESRVNGSTI